MYLDINILSAFHTIKWLYSRHSLYEHLYGGRTPKKMHFNLSVNVFSAKVLIGDTIFYVSNWRRDRHFTWSSEPREGLACCSAKGVPSFLGYFKTLSIGPAPGIEPATSRSAVKHALPTELTLPRFPW